MIVSSSRLRFTLALLGAACVAPGCSGPETREVRRVRIGSTDTMMEFHFGDGDAQPDLSEMARQFTRMSTGGFARDRSGEKTQD